MVGICWLSDCFRARPQETNPLGPADRKYPWQAAGCPGWDAGTISFRLRKDFEGSGAYTDPQKGPGEGCQMWYVNSWALGWSRNV